MDLISKYPKAAILCSKSGLWLNNEIYRGCWSVQKMSTALSGNRILDLKLEDLSWGHKYYWVDKKRMQSWCSISFVSGRCGHCMIVIYGFLNPFDKYMFVNWKCRRRSLWKDFFLYLIMFRLVFVVCRLHENGFAVTWMLNLSSLWFLNNI